MVCCYNVTCLLFQLFKKNMFNKLKILFQIVYKELQVMNECLFDFPVVRLRCTYNKWRIKHFVSPSVFFRSLWCWICRTCRFSSCCEATFSTEGNLAVCPNCFGGKTKVVFCFGSGMGWNEVCFFVLWRFFVSRLFFFHVIQRVIPFTFPEPWCSYSTLLPSGFSYLTSIVFII